MIFASTLQHLPSQFIGGIYAVETPPVTPPFSYIPPSKYNDLATFKKALNNAINVPKPPLRPRL